MKSKRQKGLYGGKRLQCMALAALLLMSLALAPSRAFAQCEDAGVADAAAAAVAGDQTAGAAAMVAATGASWSADLDVLRGQLGVEGRDAIMAKLNQFWARWRGAWQGMDRQISAGLTSQTRDLGSIADSNNLLKAALETQKLRVRSKFNNQPTDAACRFDTAAAYLTTSRQTSEALASGYEWDLLSIGNNQKDSIGELGPAGVTYHLWNQYFKYFCDWKMENGKPGCQADIPTKNMDALPGKMLFSKDTIDLSDPVERAAAEQMIYNVSGFKVPLPMARTSLGTLPGINQVLQRRKYLAQISAVNALLYSVLAERAPGKPAPEIKELRLQMGAIDPSDTPSTREIRQSMLEQLWDPNYYRNLYDNPNTIAQKEIYLKAYNLMMLYDLVAKQEKVSMVYAIQTGNMLDAADGGSRNTVDGQGFQ